MVTTAATDHLFEIFSDDDPNKCYLPEEQAQHFYYIVAQLLFLLARARRDIQTMTAFLTTRVGKLKWILKYLNISKHMKLSFEMNNLSAVNWWVDVSYDSHSDCKGNTREMMSLGKSSVVSLSKKQILNTRSSIVNELLRVHDALPWILWMK